MKGIMKDVVGTGIHLIVFGICGIIATLIYDNIMGRETHIGLMALTALFIFSFILGTGLVFAVRAIYNEKSFIRSFQLTIKEMSGTVNIGKGPKSHDLQAIYMSFALANYGEFNPKSIHGKRKILKLREYIKYKFNVDLDLAEIERGVMEYIKEIKNESRYYDNIAAIFTKDGDVPKYRLGAGFCPDCGMFKNYKKECPYCGHHEITL